MSDVDHIRVEEIAAAVPDGALLGVPADYSGVPMAVTRALIARGARDLRLYCLPLTTMQGDMLIGASCVAEIEAAAVTMGEYGLAPCFSRAFEAGALAMRDSTCPALHTQLQAVEKGVPFMPLRGLIGSDIARFRPEWRTVQNPFSDQPDEIALLPARPLDVTVFHAPYADRQGNIYIGRRRELATLAHASREVFVTVEKIVDTDLFETEATAAGALPAFNITALAVAENGAWPVGLQDIYPPDSDELRRYVSMARTEAAFAEYLAGQGLAARTAA
ncbi:MAG TPA: CoA transferase [Paracoccaceae bacterium]|nr:CoA transferase [Paracoccaceae bacterium]